MNVQELLTALRTEPEKIVSGVRSAASVKADRLALAEAGTEELKDIFCALMGMERAGFEFRYGQEEVIRAVLRGRDVMAVMPTSTGKSVCYQFPALFLPEDEKIIIIEPLNALLKDQLEEMNRLTDCAVMMKEKQRYKPELKKNRIFFVSPETFLSPKFVKFMRSVKISMLVVDEAHCVSTWGTSFREDYARLARFYIQTSSKPQVCAFTATASAFVKEDILFMLRMQGPFELEKDERQYRKESILWRVRRIKPRRYLEKREEHLGWHREYERPGAEPEGEEKMLIAQRLRDSREKLAKEMADIELADKFRTLSEDIEEVFAPAEGRENRRIIVYCSSVKVLERLYARLLTGAGDLGVYRYHARMDPEEKIKNQEGFGQEGKRIMVATQAFGMGINTRDVLRVIHFEMPRDLEGYFQEAGRAGRDMAPGETADSILYDYFPDTYRFGYHGGGGGENGDPGDTVDISDGFRNTDLYAEEKRFRNKLFVYRLEKMKAFMRAEGSSEDRMRAITDYFLNDRPRLTEEETAASRERLDAFLTVPGSIYLNVTKLANLIKKGDFKPGRPQSVRLGRTREDSNSLTFTVGKEKGYKPDLYDLFIADAVYTLLFFGDREITPLKVYRVLTGLRTREPEEEQEKDLLARIKRLRTLPMSIRDSSGKLYKGNFLELSPQQSAGGQVFFEPKLSKGEIKYPPLFRYADSCDEYFAIPAAWLSLRDPENGSFLEDTPSAVCLKLLVAWRLRIMTRYLREDEKRLGSSVILYHGRDVKNPGLGDLTGLDTAQLSQLLNRILYSYEENNIIFGYQFVIKRSFDEMAEMLRTGMAAYGKRGYACTEQQSGEELVFTAEKDEDRFRFVIVRRPRSDTGIKKLIFDSQSQSWKEHKYFTADKYFGSAVKELNSWDLRYRTVGKVYHRYDLSEKTEFNDLTSILPKECVSDSQKQQYIASIDGIYVV
ncbi:MAG: ATP-dependent DNA helicase RecQ [Ruminococcus sp.]|nr:ATP-dependent DNA helicase RecQ [Ruminococcus sp.]